MKGQIEKIEKADDGVKITVFVPNPERPAHPSEGWILREPEWVKDTWDIDKILERINELEEDDEERKALLNRLKALREYAKDLIRYQMERYEITTLGIRDVAICEVGDDERGD